MSLSEPWLGCWRPPAQFLFEIYAATSSKPGEQVRLECIRQGHRDCGAGLGAELLVFAGV